MQIYDYDDDDDDDEEDDDDDNDDDDDDDKEEEEEEDDDDRGIDWWSVEDCIKLYKWLAFWQLEKPTQLAPVLS